MAELPELSLLPVVLSGGSGSRLWPLSRENQPKQFLSISGGLSLLQETVNRLTEFAHGQCPSCPLVVCNHEHRFTVAEQLLAARRQPSHGASTIILEPCGRNTAPALTLAAMAAMSDGADHLLLVMPADHVVADTAAFHAAVSLGLAAAEQGQIVTFGIAPTHPETGYGYLKTGEDFADGMFSLAGFFEKPNSELAIAYLNSGNYLWNSGLFMLRASVWLQAISCINPEIFSACQMAYNKAKQDEDFLRIDAAAFFACPADSIDYAVMEKLVEYPELGISGVVIPLQAGWSDVGAWDSFLDVMGKDADGNGKHGDVVSTGCTDSLFYSASRLVAGVGLTNTIVVETPDAILVMDKSCAQDVKKVVAQLKGSGRHQVAMHRKNYRPWGWYDAIDSGERFQVKRIVVKPGAALSLQMHHHRAEHWIVVKGTAEVTNGDQVILLSENESTYIPLGNVHRLANPGKTPLEIIEVQSGGYLGEDDIVRFEDNYGRAPGRESELSMPFSAGSGAA